MSQPLVLAIDDDRGMRALLKMELEQRGFEVQVAPDGEEGLRLADELRPDVILLDVNMPGMTGHDLLKELKDRRSVPVILVSANELDRDKVRGLEEGADDYVAKPFNLDELAARIRAVLRRAVGFQLAGEVVSSGDVEVHLGQRTAFRAGEEVPLTRMEWLVLQHLVSNAGSVVSNEDLLNAIWGPEYRDDTQYIRVWVNRLRRKLERVPERPEIIRTIPRIGYLFVASGAAAASA